jgi:hypothetical protein
MFFLPFLSFSCTEKTTSDTAQENLILDTGEPSVEPVGLELISEWAFEETHRVEVDDIFAIWWDPNFTHDEDLSTMFGWLKEIRQDCLENLNMEDPPNPAAGRYYNVYIHHGEEDGFPNSWVNGQGTDRDGMPYLALPNGAHLEHGNVMHEGFHIFQYMANSSGFAYQGDSQWYIESTAQWYRTLHQPEVVDLYVEAGALVENPHLALWHSFSNEASGDPTDWMYQVRQYAMHAYLYFLTEHSGVNPEIISGGFYAQTSLSPQEYHYEQIGGDNLRQYFADWAAHNTGGLDYLTPEQVARAWQEVEVVGDPENRNPTVGEWTDSGVTEFQPDPIFAPRGWGYNVVNINTTEASSYLIVLGGDTAGSEGAESHFEGRVVILGSTGTRYHDIDMSGRLAGIVEVSVLDTDTELYVVIAAVPENFTGNQTYGYTLDITREE